LSSGIPAFGVVGLLLALKVPEQPGIDDLRAGETPIMTVNHKLRVAIRLDLELRWARMEIRGCLTEENCRALVVVVERSRRILRVPTIVIDAGRAQHVERGGLDALNISGILGPTAPTSHGTTGEPSTCSLVVPDVLPDCPAHAPARQSPGPDTTRAVPAPAPAIPIPPGAHRDR
jgi:hypothetical protein